jgi:hypothetical protein
MQGALSSRSRALRVGSTARTASGRALVPGAAARRAGPARVDRAVQRHAAGADGAAAAAFPPGWGPRFPPSLLERVKKFFIGAAPRWSQP